jgi:hypothetical protein
VSSRSELDIARISAALPSDPYLQAMIGLADSGSTYVVGLLAGGMTIYGRTSTSRAAAEDPTGWDEVAEVVAGAWAQRLEDRQEKRRELIDRLGGREWDELDLEEQREAIEDRPRFLTLADTRIFAPGASEAIEVATLRIPLGAIAAWWLVPTNEDGTASFTHPSP